MDGIGWNLRKMSIFSTTPSSGRANALEIMPVYIWAYQVIYMICLSNVFFSLQCSDNFTARFAFFSKKQINPIVSDAAVKKTHQINLPEWNNLDMTFRGLWRYNCTKLTQKGTSTKDVKNEFGYFYFLTEKQKKKTGLTYFFVLIPKMVNLVMSTMWPFHITRLLYCTILWWITPCCEYERNTLKQNRTNKPHCAVDVQQLPASCNHSVCSLLKH